MATDKQIAANRRNALKSTGPRSVEGKAAVRFNALQHGVRAQTLFLDYEDRATFDSLRDGLQEEWQPLGPTEMFYLEQMLAAYWKIRRVDYFEHAVYHAVTDPLEQLAKLQKLWQEQHRLERAFNKAQQELERLQASRFAGDEPVGQALPSPNPTAAQEAAPLDHLSGQPTRPEAPGVVEENEAAEPLAPAVFPQSGPVVDKAGDILTEIRPIR